MQATATHATSLVACAILILLSLVAVAVAVPLGRKRPIALITGGTRGIGSGIATALAEEGYDLLLTYNTDRSAADAFAKRLSTAHGTDGPRVECVGGDISLCATRDAIFEKLDAMLAESGGRDGEEGRRLAVLVHNAGQWAGVTSENSEGIEGSSSMKAFGDGSLIDDNGRADLAVMHYYQRMYGEAFIDLCERSLLRMGDAEDGGGSIIGISNPGVCAHLYRPDSHYSLNGAGKSLIEYSARIYAGQVAGRGINVNVIAPGITETTAWDCLAKGRGMDSGKQLIQGMVERRVPLKKAVTPMDIGNLVKFLCSDSGKFLTGSVLPCDGGLHLKI